MKAPCVARGRKYDPHQPGNDRGNVGLIKHGGDEHGQKRRIGLVHLSSAFHGLYDRAVHQSATKFPRRIGFFNYPFPEGLDPRLIGDRFRTYQVVA